MISLKTIVAWRIGSRARVIHGDGAGEIAQQGCHGHHEPANVSELVGELSGMRTVQLETEFQVTAYSMPLIRSEAAWTVRGAGERKQIAAGGDGARAVHHERRVSAGGIDFAQGRARSLRDI